MAERVRVEVAYALPQRQWLVALDLPAGATAADACEASGLATHVDGEPDLGIHGRACAPQTPLRDGDRVELYRPLGFDPKESRRRRAAHAARR